jgi:hypothetical protein
MRCILASSVTGSQPPQPQCLMVFMISFLGEQLSPTGISASQGAIALRRLDRYTGYGQEPAGLPKPPSRRGLGLPEPRCEMRLLRVEVYRAGEMLEARIFPNLGCANLFAEHQRAHGFFALVTYPRGEPWRDFRYMAASPRSGS